uniref:Uncharacterized protein n=1 Tax=Anopheles epiroticus TaxID=199890 RepID=A0A182PK70_9DIPT
MSLEESRRTQRPYRYGMMLLCVGALVNWLGLAENYSEPGDDPVHVISASEERRREKPPDYDTVAAAPPSYDDAIKLDPAALLRLSNVTTNSNANSSYVPTVHPSSSQSMSSRTVHVQSNETSQTVDCYMAVVDEKLCSEKPPPYVGPNDRGTSISTDEQTSRNTN